MYPAGADGIRVRWISSGGLSIRVLESGPVRESAVVLVHGCGASAYTFSETIPALTAAGHRVLALDLPGHGLSDKPLDAMHYTTSAMANVVLATVAACGVRKFTLMAHSMGGAVALEIASRGGTGLERLALSGAVGLGRVPLAPLLRFLTPGYAARVIPWLLTRSVIRIVLRMAFGTRDRPVERDVDEYWAPTQFNTFALACRACIHAAEWGRASPGTLQSLDVPVLVIAGGRDWIVLDVAAGGRMIPGARVVEIPEAGHLAVQERSTQCNAELLAFLGEPARQAVPRPGTADR
jgi:pimeloyl-ACP methyl ester carboxylesterase